MKKRLKAGDWVEVRRKEEILRTLDSKGQLEGTSFMPEMFQFCGQKFQVYKRAHKTCDYTTPYPYRTRRLHATVHLETRCDGSGHDGCQARCLLNWKEAWLKPIEKSPNLVDVTQIEDSSRQPANAGCSEADVWANTKIGDPNSGSPTYICQATQVPSATTFLNWWDIRQYIEDYTSGNATLGRIITSLTYSAYYNLSQTGIGLGRPMRWLYDKLSPLWGGPKWPRTPGAIPAGSPTPAANLNLQPGELVRAKSHEEILQMVTTDNRNRGMYWDAELVPYCGGTYRVNSRVSRLIDEKTSKMIEMKTACIILDGVTCQARYSACRMLCPKSMYPYWREVWLERVAEESQASSDNRRNDLAAAGSRTL